MVSKSIKKTPTKTIKDRRRSRRKKTPIKSVAAVSSIIVTSINNSIHSCHRRLIKIFSKLAKIGTPSPKNRKKKPKQQGYQILPKFPVIREIPYSPRRELFTGLLPPSDSPEKRTIFLDLDETLVHSKPNPPPEKYDFVVRPVIDGVQTDFYVLIRPFVDEFLEFLAEKFEVVIFTAGLEEYASLVLDRLDRRGLISHRLYRNSCREVEGKFVKDLGEVGRDLRRLMIVDDNPNAYFLQPENAIPVKPFTDNLCDSELKKLKEFLESCNGLEDMRDVVKQYLAGQREEKNVVL